MEAMMGRAIFSEDFKRDAQPDNSWLPRSFLLSGGGSSQKV